MTTLHSIKIQPKDTITVFDGTDKIMFVLTNPTDIAREIEFWGGMYFIFSIRITCAFKPEVRAKGHVYWNGTRLKMSNIKRS